VHFPRAALGWQRSHFRRISEARWTRGLALRTNKAPMHPYPSMGPPHTGAYTLTCSPPMRKPQFIQRQSKTKYPIRQMEAFIALGPSNVAVMIVIAIGLLAARHWLRHEPDYHQAALSGGSSSRSSRRGRRRPRLCRHRGLTRRNEAPRRLKTPSPQLCEIETPVAQNEKEGASRVL